MFGPPLSPEQEGSIATQPIRWLQAADEERNDCYAYRGHVESLEDFYIIWQRDLESARAAQHELSSFFSASENARSFTPRSLLIGQPLAFKEIDSNFGWERVEVRALDARCLKCQSYENGREVKLLLPLDVERLRSLPSFFAQQPALARRVRLQHLSQRLRLNRQEAVALFKAAGDQSQEFRVFISACSAVRPEEPSPVGIEVKLPGALWQDVRAWIHLHIDKGSRAGGGLGRATTLLPA